MTTTVTAGHARASKIEHFKASVEFQEGTTNQLTYIHAPFFKRDQGACGWSEHSLAPLLEALGQPPWACLEQDVADQDVGVVLVPALSCKAKSQKAMLMP